MVWEGDRLFCFLQQSKLETCGSPDKLSRVGELAGLITGRAKTGQLDRTPLDHSENWNSRNRIVLVLCAHECVCVRACACLERRVWTTVHLFSLRLCHPWLPLPPPPSGHVHTNTHNLHIHTHTRCRGPGQKDCLNVFSCTGQLSDEVASHRLPLVGHFIQKLTQRNDWTWTSKPVITASL